MKENGISDCLAGRKLYGDDFGPEELRQWFLDEQEAYADLGAKDRDSYTYEHHQLNLAHCYRFLPPGEYEHVLGFGAAYGEELLPVIEGIRRITILDPSDAFECKHLQGVPMTYLKPRVDGSLPFGDACFDLITCFGALHHVPNVSRVVSEFFRCLKPGGYVLMREPTVSMGDWRRPRPRLTKRERGIPPQLFDRIIMSTGFEVVSRRRCIMPLTTRLRWLVRGPVYNSRVLVSLDSMLCALFAWNRTYHAKHAFAKLRPAALAWVLRKP